MARRGKGKDRETETFSLSFLDAVTCAFGAVILLLVLTKIYEPQTIERSKEQVAGLIAALQAELFALRGETAIMNRDMLTVDEQLSESKDRVARLRGDVSDVRGKFEASSDDAAVDSELRGELVAARQRLTDEMKILLADYTPPENETTVGGISVDSRYIIFIIDTSGSMQGVWPLVLRKVEEALSVYPKVEGIQVMNDQGKYMFPRYAGKWIPDSPGRRQQIITALASWSPYSNSSPVEGIAEAISAFYEPGRKISIFVLGDDLASGQSVESVARFVDDVNKSDADGERLMRIHAIGFPTQYFGGAFGRFQRFSNLMRTLCERNGGSFVTVTDLSGQGRPRIIINGRGI